MKILYIAPENTVGTLSLWKKAHEEIGNECRYITFYPNAAGFVEDICLNLPLISTNIWFMYFRHKIYQASKGLEGGHTEKDGYPPTWLPDNVLQEYFFRFRDFLWKYKVESNIQKYKLLDYDIYHFEWGLDFYRHCGFAKRIFNNQKPIICQYHGQDLRTRGVIPIMDNLSNLNLTNETDLLQKHPNIEYLPLPFDVKSILPKDSLNKKIKICHSTTNRLYKKSEVIIEVCKKLQSEKLCEFILIEGIPHDKAMRIKQKCDINIDHISSIGGWGYGMNSIEAMAMGLCCLTYLIPECNRYFQNHPFINVDEGNLEPKLRNLLLNPKLILEKGKLARDWVYENHHYENIRTKLYNKYIEYGFIE